MLTSAGRGLLCLMTASCLIGPVTAGDGGLYSGTSGKLELRENYLPTLGLNKVPAQKAMERLLADGYQCGLHHGRVRPGIRGPSLYDSHLFCIRRPSGFQGCDSLEIQIRWATGETLDRQLTFREALAQLDRESEDPWLDCSPTFLAVQVVERWVQPKKKADIRFSTYVRNLNLKKMNAKDAWFKLMGRGLSCSFGTKKYVQEASTVPPQISCAGISYGDPNPERYRDTQCYRPTVTLKLKTPHPVTTRQSILDQLSNSKVVEVHSECVLPDAVVGEAI